MIGCGPQTLKRNPTQTLHIYTHTLRTIPIRKNARRCKLKNDSLIFEKKYIRQNNTYYLQFQEISKRRVGTVTCFLSRIIKGATNWDFGDLVGLVPNCRNAICYISSLSFHLRRITSFTRNEIHAPASCFKYLVPIQFSTHTYFLSKLH